MVIHRPEREIFHAIPSIASASHQLDAGGIRGKSPTDMQSN